MFHTELMVTSHGACATFETSNPFICKRSQVPEIDASRAGGYSPSMPDALIAARFGACDRLRLMSKNAGRIIMVMVAMLMLFAGPVTASTKVPHFRLPSPVDGSVVDSKDMEGKVLLISFFATWCPPCREEVPSLIRLQEEFADKGFSVIALSVDENDAKGVSKFVKRMKINYPVAIANPKVARDFGGIVGIPISFLVDREGNVVKSYPGFIDHRIFVKDINSLCGKSD